MPSHLPAEQLESYLSRRYRVETHFAAAVADHLRIGRLFWLGVDYHYLALVCPPLLIGQLYDWSNSDCSMRLSLICCSDVDLRSIVVGAALGCCHSGCVSCCLMA